MYIKNKIFIFYLFTIIISCNNAASLKIEKSQVTIDDSQISINQNYKIGDLRRYGIFPNKKINQKKLKQVLLLASKGMPIIFPQGYYKTNIILDSISNLDMSFNKVTIAGTINIINNSNKINFKGHLRILDKLFIRESNNISFDTLLVKTDTILNLHHKKNRGVSIYAGTKNVSFQFLKIHNTGGSSDPFYKYSAAALQIHGWNNNPERVYIDELEIINADRTGLYITGENHKIKKATITNFGLGISEKMYGLEDATPNEEKEFSGAWINRCNNCEIDTLQVISNVKKGKYSLRLDEGKYHQPTFIYNIHIGGKAKNLPIKDNELTNILVKNEY